MRLPWGYLWNENIKSLRQHPKLLSPFKIARALPLSLPPSVSLSLSSPSLSLSLFPPLPLPLLSSVPPPLSLFLSIYTHKHTHTHYVFSIYYFLECVQIILIVSRVGQQVGLEARSDCGGWKNEWGVRSQTPLGQGLNLIVLVSSVPCIIPGTWCLLH